MASSEFQYRVVIDTNAIGDSPAALGTITARAIENNLCHLADEAAQVRVVMGGTVPALSGKAGYLTSRAPSAIDTPYAITSWTFPISVRASQASYKLRIRIGGASANAAATAYFVAVLSPGREAPSAATDASDAVYITAGTASTSAAWLTGISQGDGAYTTMVMLDSFQLASCMAEFPTTDVFGGDATSVSLAWVTLSIFAQTTNVTHVPRLYNVYAAEVIGL